MVWLPLVATLYTPGIQDARAEFGKETIENGYHGACWWRSPPGEAGSDAEVGELREEPPSVGDYYP